MRNNRIIRAKGFPRGRWKVVWYGDLRLDPSPGRSSQPYIDLVLEGDGGGRTRRQRVPRPFGDLSLIPLGSIWEDEVRVIERPAQGLITRKIDVVPIRVGEVKAGARLEGSGEHLLPYDHGIDRHVGDTTAPCLWWRTSTGETIVVPATEAVRFYFGTSSYLLTRILTGRPPINEMWDVADLNAETRVAHLHLAPEVPLRQHVAQIARIALDPRARRAAEIVRRSSIAASGRRERIYPRTSFPFAGPSTLTVAGIPIERRDGPPTFLVLRIDSCTAPYPHQRLIVTGGSEIKAFDLAATNVDSGTDGLEQAALQVEDGDPSSDRIAHGESHWEGHRFPDLIRKTIDFVNAPPASLEGGGGGPPARDESHGLGEGTASGHGRPLVLSNDSETPSIAFIEDRLLGDEDPLARWQALEAQLLGGENPILPVLMAAALPPWASSMTGTSICILPSDYLTGHAMDLDPLEEWRLSNKRESTDWHVFVMASTTRMMWTEVSRLDDLATTIVATFRWCVDDAVMAVVNSTIADIIS